MVELVDSMGKHSSYKYIFDMERIEVDDTCKNQGVSRFEGRVD